MPLATLVPAVAGWVAFAPALFNDGDTSWHLAAGRWIIDYRAIPTVDPFSFTFRGHAWTAHEWLAEVGMAGLFGAIGWAGLALLFAVSVAALLVLVGRELQRWLPPRYLVLALAALMVVIAPFLLARPHVLAWPLLAAWTLIMIIARERGTAPPLYAALIMLVWANLHASYLFGLLLVGPFALEAVVAERDKRRALLGWGGFGLAALLLAFITPHGLQGFLYPFQVSGMKALPLIDEWRATRLPKDWPFAVVAAAMIAAAIVRRRRIPGLRLLTLALLLGLAVTHARHQPLFAIVGLLILARPLGEAGSEPKARPPLPMVAIGLLAVLGVRLALPLDRAEGPSWPAAAITHVATQLRGEPVLNSYSIGGPLILAGIAPYIDGRADMYGDAFTIDHQKMMTGDLARFRLAEKRWGLRWTILDRRERLADLLDHEPGWQKIYADRWAVVHVRDGGVR